MILQPEISLIFSLSEDQGLSKIERTLSSFLSQSFFDFELILINSTSNDKITALCNKYVASDLRVKYIQRTKSSSSLAKIYNEAISMSRGRFITSILQDEEWLPNALEELYLFFIFRLKTYKNLGMIYASEGETWCVKKITQRNFLINCPVLIRRDIINKVGAFDESPFLQSLFVWDLWQRIGRRYRVDCLEKMITKIENRADSSLVNTRGHFYYRLFRFSYPLKSKRLGQEELLFYLYTFYTIYYPSMKLSPDFVHKIKLSVKKALIFVGGWRFCKALYDRLS